MIASAESYPPSAYSLFLRGFDTVEIAVRLKRPEHEIVRELTVERSRAKGAVTSFEPSPYKQARAQNWRDVGNRHLGPIA